MSTTETAGGGGEKTCSWSFGEKPNSKNPGWQNFLNFRFNPATKRVDPASLECIGVP